MPINENGLYVAESMTFVNTREFTRTRQNYEKYGYYIDAPEGSKDWWDFWQEEQRRRKDGYSVGGVHITGEHYGYLNYGRILMTSDVEDDALTGVVKMTNQQMRSGRKTISFPDFWDGDYHWFKAKEEARRLGLHICCGKARRKGFSYKEAWDSADSVNMNPYMTVVIAAFDKKYLTKGDGTMRMAINYLDFLEDETAFARGYLTTQTDEYELGYVAQGSKIKKGYRSKLIAVSCGPDNPDAIIGKDAFKVKMEEAGKFPNLIDTLEVTLPTMEDGDIVTGQICVFGTGGTKDANWEAFEKVFFEPELFGFMSFDNVWDENMSGTSCGFFFPHYQNLKPYIDKDGNSDIETAKRESDKKREKKKQVAKSNADYMMYIGQRAYGPAEAFSRSSDNIFPGAEIAEQLRRVESDRFIKHLGRTGRIVSGEEGYKLVESDQYAPVPYPRKRDTDPTGCFIEWQPPYKKDGKVPNNLYRIWHDPYAHDKDKDKISTTDSLGALYVYERINNMTPTRGDILVASYVGRPSTMDEYNEQLYRIAKYYNAEIMFENDRGDVKRFFQHKKAYEMLADEPEITWKKQLSSKTGRNKGMHMTTQRIGTGAMYLRDWLLEKRGVDEQTGQDILNLHYIYDTALLNELLKWNLKGNFDRVSSLLVGMYDMKEVFFKEVEEVLDNDPTNFFNRSLFQ
jgi:hypothetical protein